MLGHCLTTRSGGDSASDERISVIAPARALELRPDEEYSLDRGRKLYQFSWRLLPAL
jgi:hypothetical protein